MPPEQLKNPRSKDQGEQIINVAMEQFAGVRNDPPADSIDNAVFADAEDVKIFPTWFEGRCGTKLTNTTPLPNLPDREFIYDFSKTGNIVTKSVTPDFSANDVGNYVVYDDGTCDLITAFIDINNVTVFSSKVRPASFSGSVRGPVNSIDFHPISRYIFLHIDTRVFYTDISFTAYTEVVKTCAVTPSRYNSTIRFLNDDIFLFDRNGLFKIYLDGSIYKMLQANMLAPTNYIYETAETAIDKYGRRYIVTLSVLSGSDILRNRQTDGVRVVHESSPFIPNTANNDKDYAEIFSATERNSVGGSYQELIGNQTMLTFAQAKATMLQFANPNSFFDVTFTINGIERSATLTDVGSCNSWYDYAQKLQDAIRRYGHNCTDVATVNFIPTGSIDGGRFYVTGGRQNGTTITANFKEYVIDSVTWTKTELVNPAQKVFNLGGGIVVDRQINNIVYPLYLPFLPTASLWDHQPTHFTVYATRNTGPDAELNPGVRESNPNLNVYSWHSDVPIGKAFVASTDGSGVLTVTQGTILPEDVGNTLYFAVAGPALITRYDPSSGQFYCSIPLIASQACAFGATTSFYVQQIGNNVQRIYSSAGAVFSSVYIGQHIDYSDGRRVTIIDFIDVNNVTVAESGSFTGPAVIGAFNRTLSDVIDDKTLESRESSWLMKNRFMQPLPNGDLGAICPGFCISGNLTETQVRHSQITLGAEHLIGCYNPAYQYYNFEDSLASIEQFPDLVVFYCKKSTYRGPTNSPSFVGIPNSEQAVALLPGITIIDSRIGCLDRGSIQNIENGIQILITSEPGIRVFDGYKYGPNLLLDGDGIGNYRDSIRKLQMAIASLYDPDEGYVIWGTESDI